MKEKANSDKSEGTKSCPYCMGELALDAVKCKHCGEWIEEKKKRQDRPKREDGETAKREVRRAFQDKAREQMKSDKSKRPESAQKGVSESKGIKSWWAAQSGVSKGILVLFVGLVAFGGIYLASGSDQDVPGTDTNQISSVANDSINENSYSSNKKSTKRTKNASNNTTKVNVTPNNTDSIPIKNYGKTITP